jgi:cysteine desulfurase
MPAYLDHAASTPMRPDAVEAMVPYLREHFANPSGAHAPARQARKAIDEARDACAEALGVEPREIVFTGGGTEADNLAVFGVHDRMGGLLVGSAIEHHAVLEPIEARGGRLVPVDGTGRLDLDALAAVLDDASIAGPPVTLVSVMLANNEVGTIQDLAAVARVVRRHAPGAVLHTDAVQAFAWLRSPLARSADLISISAQVRGPAGVPPSAGCRRPARPLFFCGVRASGAAAQNVAGMWRWPPQVRRRAATPPSPASAAHRLVDGLRRWCPTRRDRRGRHTGPDAGVDRSHKTRHRHVHRRHRERNVVVPAEQAGISAPAASRAPAAQEPSYVLVASGAGAPGRCGSPGSSPSRRRRRS